jgi:uncharacterized protein YuzE
MSAADGAGAVRAHCILRAMRVTYDNQADAAYIYLREIELGGAKATVPVIGEDSVLAGEVILDVDADGRLIGIEVLNAKRGLPEQLLEKARGPLRG